MIRLTPEEPERRRRAQFGRTVMGISALLFMIMSAVLPHVPWKRLRWCPAAP